MQYVVEQYNSSSFFLFLVVFLILEIMVIIVDIINEKCHSAIETHPKVLTHPKKRSCKFVELIYNKITLAVSNKNRVSIAAITTVLIIITIIYLIVGYSSGFRVSLKIERNGNNNNPCCNFDENNIFTCKYPNEKDDVRFLVLRNDNSSKVDLKKFQNKTKFNESEKAHFAKVTQLWSNRGDFKDNLSCTTARIISIGNEPQAIFNIGITGEHPTIKDNSVKPYGKVYEFSGLWMTDGLVSSLRGKSSRIKTRIQNILNATRLYLQNCKAEANYTKAVYTTAKEDNLQFFYKAGGEKLTSIKHSRDLFGPNFVHPERFRFDRGGGLKECIDWAGAPISNEGFHDSAPCSNWVETNMVVFNISNNKIGHHSEL